MKNIVKFLSVVIATVFLSSVLATNEVQAFETSWGNFSDGSSLYNPLSNQTSGSSNKATGELVYGPYSNEYMDAHPETNFAIRNDTKTYESSSSGTGTGTGNANIFEILRAKIYSTLVDLRKIVYVIAGFGLVMFAVLAIFNKVSYKHLGYIMISLCLLSLMFPFLEYFSGAGTIQKGSQTEMDFKNFLDTQYAVITGTSGEEINAAMNGLSQEGAPFCDGEDCGENEQLSLLTADLSVPTMSAADALKSGSMKNMTAFTNAGCPPSGGKGAWKADGTRPVCSTDANGNPVITTEQCTGKLNKKGDKCVKTAAQTWSDIINGVTATANFVASGVNTVVGVAATGAALVSGGTNVVNAIKDLGNAGNVHDVLAGLQNIAGATSGAATGVTMGFQSVLGGLGGAASSVGSLATIAATNPETNPTGANTVVTGAANFNQNLNTVNQQATNNLTATNKALGEASQVVRTTDNTVSTIETGVNSVKGYMGIK